ncbi:MAG: alpha-amylase, partial [Spirochaetes bacterium]|nr:alpha-amylase [Candidatus Gallitreponema excrementavium]
MARNTKAGLRNCFIYQVFPRNYSEEGTFSALANDLDRIKALGADFVYLLPIHPIGQKDKKGSLGCPYSIQDYKKVNPELGTLEDFKSLVKQIHNKGIKIMIDVVFNHTSRDSRLLAEHPEWFYRKKDGSPANRVGDWSDVTDLDYSKEGVEEELISTLVYWAELGVDGYRCDVASLVPHDFWIKAREAVSKVNPDFVWLAETVDPGFVRYLRALGYEVMSDSETFDAFDICYDYDIFE